ncbi:M20 metallopeptidase family protein [Sulfidibacter corallicola]|uniref:Amidohydrolase n=1 Tax=Sulfidibacter corallicola TaxID=2818388 RepID=A0A8A4TI81_SULCO|nr:M20 family metallopeptidase [Sulfidibacter corallicola]QTD49260.1 amidohydrolase [Sulfidibacter corallicola]
MCWFVVLGADLTIDRSVQEEMLAVRRHLHRHPELSNREFETQAYLKEKIAAAGFDRITVHAKTGLRVVYDTGKPGRTLAFRADIDALPVTEQTGLPFSSQNEGVMHACGHDMHTAILFGAMLSIKNDPDLTGTFVFLFQPAEEGPPPGEEGGASLMIADGALSDPVPDVIFGLHTMGNLPVGHVGYRSGGIMARADRFFLTVRGKQAHGSTPEAGIDPIYIASAIVTQAQSIVSRRTDSRDPVVVSFGEFLAGQRFNIIPDEARLSGTIRTLDVETGDRIPQLLDQIIAGITEAHGAEYKFENETMCPSTQNHPKWTRHAVAALQDSGFQTTPVQPVLAAEDFAYYAEKIPGVYFFLGVCDQDECANIHSPHYKPSEAALEVGARMFYTYAKSFCSGALDL